ncbi:MAG TPA: efflux RND transporter permease subunit [Treponemataceae bacterium]|nr:efflux RND transporter permease subunit [Treponemataceae bacterium]
MSVSSKVVKHPVLTVIAFSLIGIISLYSLINVAIDLLPDFSMPIIVVYTTYDSAGPESVEKSVTKTLEASLTGLSNLKDITSTSSEETSLIKLEFNYGTDLESATNDIRDKIDRVKGALPDDCDNPQIMKFDTSSWPIMKIAVRGNRTSEDLKEIADDYIVDRLQQANGVAQASASGGRAKIVRVDISQNRLEAYGLTMTQVASSLAAQNLELGGGRISEGSKTYSVRTVGEYASLDEINNAIVATKNGYVVHLSDIGKAAMGYEDVSSYVYINGEPGVYVSITKQSGSNTVSVSNAVYKKLDEIRKVVPADVKLELVSDSSEQVRNTVASLLKSAWEAAILAMLVLFIFLRSVKSTLIMGISIPFSILITLLCMHFAGITLNMMTMTGLILGVGMVVDASVVVLENIYQYRERGTKPIVAATIGTQEMFSVVLAGGLTHMCVFLPIIFFKNELGFLGQLFPDMIFTMIIALLSSLFVALFLVPVLASHYLVIETRKTKPLRNPTLIAADEAIGGFIARVTAAYTGALKVVMRHRKATIITVAGIFILSLTMFGRLNLRLMPDMSDQSVTLEAELPLGTRLEDTNALLQQLEAIVKDEIKGYTTIITTVGTGGNHFSSEKSYYGTITVNLPDADKQIDTMDTVKQKLRAHFGDYPTAKLSFSAGQMHQMTGADIDIAIRGDDLDQSLKVANEIVSIMKDKVPDCSEATLDMTEGLPQVEVVIDRDRAYSFGVSVASVANEINACIEGIKATVYRSHGDEYYVELYLNNADRSKVPDLEKIYVNGTNGRVPIANFARLEKGVGPVGINRENQARTIHLTADIISKTRANDVEQKIQKAIDDSIILPEGITLSYEGSWKDIAKTGMIFIMIITMALLLVYGVMAGTYESFKDPFINMFTIPLGLIGIIAIYLVSGQAISMFTAFGFVMLIGLAVNNGIIMVDQMNLLVSRGVPMRDACVQAATSRLRPVLMTSLTMLLGMVPLAFFPSANSQMIQPIGLSVFGGLLSSTLITLFLIPVLYSIVNERFGSGNKKQRKEARNVQG